VWSVDLDLPIGTSTIVVASRGSNDQPAALEPIFVVRTEARPEPPAITSPENPATVSEPRVRIIGTKPPNTSVLLNGQPIVCRGAETEWAYEVTLGRAGTTDLTFRTQDDRGQESDPTVLSVRLESAFSGKVPDGFKLQVRFELRDLSKIPGIREEFATGVNNYGIDAWIEGPIEPGEKCVIRDFQRQNIEYVATIEHYVGRKSGHTIPYKDDDYRGADYLAALISAGVYEFLGHTSGTDRRGPDGRQTDGLMGGVTDADIKANIDCFGVPEVDACTKATVRQGNTSLVPWTPRKRNGVGLLDQGEYLLWIQINLDRSGTWLYGNDFETCWDDLAYARKGMHRIVWKVALGSREYTEVVPQSAELSGPDFEGGRPLYFIGPGGVTITWGR
jgi:hypothetical protein